MTKSSKSVVYLAACRCLRCGHTWVPRGDKPRVCPKCKSPYWDEPIQYPDRSARIRKAQVKRWKNVKEENDHEPET